MNILVIDDNQSITDMICSYMNAKGHNATSIGDGRNGLQMIKQKNFDTILLDLAMPEYSGHNIIDDMVKNDLMNKNKIAILTASSVSNEDEENLIAKGVKIFLRKPIDPDELLAHLERLNSS
ncbi:response regulator [Nitrosopumilus sp. S4]